MLNQPQDIYRTPGLPPFEYNLVADRLYAGRNPLTAADVDEILSQGVTHLLDLREHWEWTPPRFGAEAVARLGDRRRSIPVTDMGEPSPEALRAASQLLNETLADPHARVYVCCRAGKERTGAVLIAWWATRNRIGYDEALAQLRRGRPSLHPLPNQEGAVRRWLATVGPFGLNSLRI